MNIRQLVMDVVIILCLILLVGNLYFVLKQTNECNILVNSLIDKEDEGKVFTFNLSDNRSVWEKTWADAKAYQQYGINNSNYTMLSNGMIIPG